MRVAALFDVHGNVPALEAVLGEVRRLGVDQIVVGGDVLPGPQPREALDLLLRLDIATRFIHGNGELAVLAQIGARDPGQVTYWGTATGAPPPESARVVIRWTADQVADYTPTLRSWPKTTCVATPLGDVLFCHSTPRSETEVFTRLTSEDKLAPVFANLGVQAVVCGHTHMQFDRMIAGTRVVNAGSVGMPFGAPGAYWALLDGRKIELRHTPYDLQAAASRIRETPYPQAREFAEQYVLRPPSEEQMLGVFTNASFK